jgi:hypothetical protein
MNSQITPVGQQAAIVFALVGHQLTAFYNEGCFFNASQGASLAAEWLARSKKKTMPLSERNRLSATALDVARQTTQTVTPETGRLIAHEVMESLDVRYRSDVADQIMNLCVSQIDVGAA